jgi:hypothetical protein
MRKIFIMLAIAATAFAAAACEIVGQGDLHVQNDLSGIGADNTVFYAFEHESGDVWPPAGQLALAVRGDDFGRPPDFGMDGYLYLVRTHLECPMSEAAPEMFELDDVTIVGVVTVTDGTVNQVLTATNESSTRSARWALIEINEFEGYEPGHLIHRCGSVTWTG